MQVISIISTKGGVGKTTVTANLGSFIADAGLRVLLLDLDMQPTLSSYFEIVDRAACGIYELLVHNERDIARLASRTANTVGAGGGSIARIDRGGILNVGPESAGATPGPVAYGRGGTEPTVTDANLVLGRINADFVLGGDKGFRMNRDAARDAIEKRIAAPLGVSVEAAASAIIRVANNNMAGRVRVVSVERGYDPRDFVMVAFGGAGPLHGAALLKETGVAACLVPLYPGVLCALGSAAADVRHDFVQTVMKTTDELDFADLQATIRRLVTEGRALIEQERYRSGRSRSFWKPTWPMRASATTSASRFRKTSRAKVSKKRSRPPIAPNMAKHWMVSAFA